LTPSTSVNSYNHLLTPFALLKPSNSQNPDTLYKYRFGLVFIGNPIEMLQLCCQILIKLDIEWQSVPSENKLKCRTKVDEKLTNDDEIIKEFLRKNFVKFYLCIFKDPSKLSEEKYMIDLVLFKGTGVVFLNFAHRFFNEIKGHCGKVGKLDRALSQNSTEK
jgi:hypothetical protein